MGNYFSNMGNFNNLILNNRLENNNFKYTKFNLYKNEPFQYSNISYKKYVPVLPIIKESINE